MSRALAEVLGPRAMVLEVPGTKEPITRDHILAQVRAAEGESIEEIAVAGWSAGCHGVRNVLETVAPEIVFTWDGTHASIPQPGSMPVAPWRTLADRARNCEVLWVATHVYNTYTNQLRPPQGPYDSTVKVLRDITGWELPEPTGTDPTIRREGELVVYSYASGPADAPAHARQIREVAGMTVREWLAPRWQARGAVRSATLSTQSHGYRCSVAELCTDARNLGKLHLRGSDYRVKAGDLIVSKRSNQNPVMGGSGHVERAVEDQDGSSVRTIGGNENNTWIDAPLNLQAPDIAAVIEVDSAIGSMAIEIAQRELAAGVKEIPGVAAAEQIQAYHAGARRGGSPLAGMPGHETEGFAVLGAHASDETPWCASAASYCQREALEALCS
ncbi:MAG: hypothetical protein JNK04_21075 [Myxococcales bacterium]|nr:hypothetical protein [Myxococcales bacterium]